MNFSNENQRFVPRAVLVDSDPAVLDVIRSSSIGELFFPDNFVYSSGSTGSNWAKGHYGIGAQMLESILDVIRCEVERCECMQGIQLFHALGGGTGSGLGSLILEQLYDHYPHTVLATCTVAPSGDHTDQVLEPYNSVLGSHALIENATQCNLFSNSTLSEVHQQLQLRGSGSLSDLNSLVARAMSTITAGSRFPGADAFGMRKLAVSTVPFPRLHFLMPSLSPISSNALQQPWTAHDFVEQLFNPRYSLCRQYGPPTKDTRYIAAACIARGAITVGDLAYSLEAFRQHNADNFVDYIPNNVAVSCTRYAEPGFPLSGVLLANSSGIVNMLRIQLQRCEALLRKKAFLHNYLDENMDEMEFYNAFSNLNDLISEYENYSEESFERPQYRTPDEHLSAHRRDKDMSHLNRTNRHLKGSKTKEAFEHDSLDDEPIEQWKAYK